MRHEAAERASSPLVSVVISTHNRADSLTRVLAALEKQTYHPIEVVVADNDSTDATAAVVRRDFPSVRFLASGVNRGFAPSINAGVAEAKGEVVISLPDDVVVEPEYVEELVRALDEPGVVAAGGVLREWPETSRINYAGGRVSRALRLRFERSRVPQRTESVTFLPGGNLAIRRADFFRLGGHDEDYGSSFEDVDFCVRVRRAGGRMVVVPAARAFHLSHPSGTSYYREYYGRRNLYIFYFKHAPGPLLLLAFFAHQILRAIPRDFVVAVARRDASLLRAARSGHAWWIGHLPLLLRKRRETRRHMEELGRLTARR